MVSPTISSELERTLACGSSVCTTTFGGRGSQPPVALIPSVFLSIVWSPGAAGDAAPGQERCASLTCPATPARTVLVLRSRTLHPPDRERDRVARTEPIACGIVKTLERL